MTVTARKRRRREGIAKDTKRSVWGVSRFDGSNASHLKSKRQVGAAATFELQPRLSWRSSVDVPNRQPPFPPGLSFLLVSRTKFEVCRERLSGLGREPRAYLREAEHDSIDEFFVRRRHTLRISSPRYEHQLRYELGSNDLNREVFASSVRARLPIAVEPVVATRGHQLNFQVMVAAIP